MGDVERAIGVGERRPSPTWSSRPLVVASPGWAIAAAARTSGRLSRATTTSRVHDRRARQERQRDVRAAGPDVEQAQLVAMRRERVEALGAQAHATEPAVDPAQVPQVADERTRVVERPVEKLEGVGRRSTLAAYCALVR